jgi:hypothetical protein
LNVVERLLKPVSDYFAKKMLSTPIDGLALFDHTMLHEMTHAVKDRGGDQDTATDDSGGMFKSYGMPILSSLLPLFKISLILLRLEKLYHLGAISIIQRRCI